MPYGSNPWGDIGGATAGMQQSMANIALMQRQAQYRMQQQAAQQALEQQRIGIERQAESRMGRATDSTIAYQSAEGRRADAETKKYGQEYDMVRQTMDTQNRLGRLKGYGNTPELMSMLMNPTTRDRIMQDLSASSVIPPVGSPSGIRPEQISQMMQNPLTGPDQALGPQNIRQIIQAALSGQNFQQAMGTAASAERYAEPVQMSANQTAFDPFSRQPVMQTGPAAPNPETARHNMAMEGKQLTPEQRLILAQMHTAGTAVSRPHADWQTVDTDTLNEVLTQAGDRFMGKTNRPSVSASQPKATTKRPTKAQALEYVKKYGQAGAHNALQKDGFDTTGYAD